MSLYRPLRKPPQHGGTTLIETIIALSILAAVALASLTGLNTLYNTLTISERRTTAESLARSQLEYVKSQPYIGDSCPSPQYQSLDPGQLPADYSIAVTAVCIDGSGTEAATDKGLQRVTVTVKHNNRDVLQVSGYKIKE